MLTSVPASRIPHEWAWMGPALVQAISRPSGTGGDHTALDVLHNLLTGEMQAWLVTGEAHGLAITDTGHVKDTDPPRKGMWVMFVAGKVDGGPKRRLLNYATILAELENEARKLRCHELWVEARADWGRLLKAAGFSVVRVLPLKTEFRKVLAWQT